MVSALEHGLGRNSWLGMLFAGGCGLILAGFYHFWMKRFGPMSIADIFSDTWGPFFSRVVTLLFLLEILFLISSAAWHISDFWRSLDMRDTPRIIYTVATFLLAAFLCYCGPEAMGRFACIVAVIAAILVGLNVLLFIPKMELKYFLPIGQISLKEFFSVSLPVFFTQYGDIFLCLPFLAHCRKPGAGTKSMLKGILFAILILTVQVSRNIACLGETISLYSYPILQTLRLFDSSQMLSLAEILGVGWLVLISFVRISIGFYVLNLLIYQIFGIKQASPYLLLPISIIAVAVSSGIFGNNTDVEYFILHIYPYISIVFCFLLPLATLVLAKIRHIKWEG